MAITVIAKRILMQDMVITPGDNVCKLWLGYTDVGIYTQTKL
jgi:hypothetical protein